MLLTLEQIQRYNRENSDERGFTPDYYHFFPEERPVKLSELLQPIADEDVKVLEKKDAEYGSSWKNRGGVGAFMMLARKWDRLETQLLVPGSDPADPEYVSIFKMAEQDERPDGIMDDIADLRRYLLLVEAEIRNRRKIDKRFGVENPPK